MSTVEMEMEKPTNIIITPEYQEVIQLVEREDFPNVFVTGNAGTGKSTLLRHLLEEVLSTRVTAVVAPTGVAALNVGGATIHSFFRFPVQEVLDPEADVQYHYSLREKMEELDTLIIDEISMVRADVLDCIDKSLRMHRDEPDKQFGGVQLIVFGDLCQLPPVVKGVAQKFLEERYASPFFFDANCVRDTPFQAAMLTTAFRQQNDPEFLEILNRIRNRQVEQEDIDLLNRRCSLKVDWNDAQFPPGVAAEPIMLTATNSIAESINTQQLRRLPMPERLYRATISGQFYENKQHPTDEFLKLRVGAQVMLVRNDPGGAFVNGSIGTVVELGQSWVGVDIEGSVVQVESMKWDKYAYTMDGRHLRATSVGSFTQLPIKLGWAVTIHKAQGKTFERVIVDFGKGAFAHGQVYVALSRCTTMAGLRLSRPLVFEDIIFDERVQEFHDRCGFPQ
jgi:ATP-dependent exoDNAse (exonuclease V) alpha subunit